MSQPLVTIERRDDEVAVLRLDNPKVNALSSELLRQLAAAARQLTAEPPGAVVVTGGDRVFAAGADISEFGGPTEAAEIGGLFLEALNAVAAIPRATIAAVSGFALGGGCELALACDLRVASEKAKAGQPEVNLGVTPGFAGTQRLAGLVGRSMAKYLLFTGEIIPADRALQIGLFDEVVAPEQLIPRCLEIAALIATKGPVAVSYCKHAVNVSAESTLAQGQAYEAELFAQAFATRDQKEGMAAFIEKRPAVFTGA